MKRFLFLLMLLIPAFGMTLLAKEVVYLKNGSILKGDIIEEVPGVSLKLKTSDGNVFVYSMDEIQRIEKNVQTTSSSNTRHRKLDFYVGTGFNIATKGGSGSVPVDLTLSKRFSPNFSAGISTGIEIGTQKGADPVIPILADFHGFLPLNSTNITPFANLRLGYAINTAESYTMTVGSGKYKEHITVDQPNYVVLSIMPGIRIPLSHTTDVDLAIGYQHYIATGDNSSGSGAFAIRAGFNFHASTDPNRAMKPRKVIPMWQSGFEAGIEASGIGNYGGSILLGYK
ncbi:MAG: hypothetical protein K2M12_08730, partial [Muribaculaceae bacterium]|nr:hypothetical protein [Muribaculaceae bacterium]